MSSAAPTFMICVYGACSETAPALFNPVSISLRGVSLASLLDLPLIFYSKYISCDARFKFKPSEVNIDI